MWKALAFKELRECLGIAAIALAACLYLVARNTGWEVGTLGSLTEWVVQLGGLHIYRGRVDDIPFVNAELPVQLGFVLALFATALGFRQTVGESLHGTYPLLLHLPVPRLRLLYAKLSLGLAIYMACGAVPILLYSVWAATPGTHASPFYWSMTVPTWISWFSMSCVYLAAFLSGLRPARWYGSRLAPLAAGVPPLFVAYGVGSYLYWWASIPIVLLSGAILVIGIQQVAQDRDFS